MRRRSALLLLLAALPPIAAGVAWLLLRQPAPSQEQRSLADGSPLQLVEPGGPVRQRVILLLSAEARPRPERLLEMAGAHAARLAVLDQDGADCRRQLRRLDEALAQLGGPADLVAGDGPGAQLAWRWLAAQSDDRAQALSIGFRLDQAACPEALPPEAPHGRWHAIWNDNPDDASARFARAQANADTQIADYGTPVRRLLLDNLGRLLEGRADPLPLVEVPATGVPATGVPATGAPAAGAGDTVAIFYSGDGGWRDLDRDVAAELAKRGYPVVGVDCLRYFWNRKSPEQAAADLARILRTYRERWGARRFALIGFSFGADVLPAIYNRLDASDQASVDSLLLLALARSGSFEIQVQGWLGAAGQDAPTAPEMARLPAAKVLCVYGTEEAAESGCTQPQSPGEKLALPGGHHYDHDYPALSERLIAAIRARRDGH
ncbi:virulence factor family protein [Azotobacter vinelandii]|uniref:virulence factor family protein n=1 Tax=Azotobacter vinelandii TaxID=354 RepID=UPI0026668C90|nr:AcvB/VirJ family lysyl-phosphatidylglycerol hydrolase [Azotobacter vinelandii]WKN23809.1 virulence factor family protein [Azotobacter vinelandii]